MSANTCVVRVVVQEEHNFSYYDDSTYKYWKVNGFEVCHGRATKLFGKLKGQVRLRAYPPRTKTAKPGITVNVMRRRRNSFSVEYADFGGPAFAQLFHGMKEGESRTWKIVATQARPAAKSTKKATPKRKRSR